MTRRGRAARATGSGDSRRRELPGTSDLCGHAGARGGGHRKAPERLPSAAGTSWELRTSRRSAGSRVGETPWCAGPMRHGSPRRLGGKRGRGRRGRESVPRLGDDGLRRGTRRSWDHGRGTSTRRLKRLQGEGGDRPRARKGARTARAGVGTTQRTRRRVTASALERTLESKPQERQRAQRARETGRRASRRGSEKLRGRTVAGEVTPRPTDLSGRCRWRGVKPQEGRPGPAGPVRTSRPEP
jgi:hypothetical protein